MNEAGDGCWGEMGCGSRSDNNSLADEQPTILVPFVLDASGVWQLSCVARERLWIEGGRK